jgi:eukaryotic-like serine/threonine-protein kinase
MAVALRHGREPIPAPSSVAEGIPPAVDEVVARATAMDPDDRYPDLDALVAALRNAVPEGPATVVVGGDGDERTLVIPPSADLPAVDEEPTFPPSGTAPAARTSRRERRAERKALRAEKAGAAGGSRSRGRKVLLGLLLSVLVLALLAGGAAAYWHLVVAPVQQVPQLTELTLDDARASAESLGLDLRIDGEETSRTVAEGVVLTQDPPPGTELRSGETVGVVVSSGPAPVEVPRVLDLPLEEAREILEDEPYFFEIVDVHEDWSDTVPAGAVIGQSPSAGVEVRQGAEVLLAVSLGVEQVEVPDLSGLSRDEVEEALSEARLSAVFEEAWSDAVPERGQVVEQSIAPGEEVDVGSAVTVTVSRGPLTVTVPSLTGEAIPDAVAALEALALRPDVRLSERRGINRIFAPGVVTRQSPDEGQRVERGTTVVLEGYAASDDDDDDD